MAFSDMRSVQEPYLHIQVDSVAWVNPVYSKSWQIENPGIFRTLPYSQSRYFENLGVYRTLAYLQPYPNELKYLRFIKSNLIFAFCCSKKTEKRFYFQTILCSSQHLALERVKRSHPKGDNSCSTYKFP